MLRFADVSRFPERGESRQSEPGRADGDVTEVGRRDWADRARSGMEQGSPVWARAPSVYRSLRGSNAFQKEPLSNVFSASRGSSITEREAGDAREQAFLPTEVFGAE